MDIGLILVTIFLGVFFGLLGLAICAVFGHSAYHAYKCLHGNGVDSSDDERV